MINTVNLTIRQFVAVSLPAILCLTILWFINRAIRQTLIAMGMPFWLVATRIGIIVHELSHTFFALIFFHKIKEVTLFGLDDKNIYGRVAHSYNPASLYQKIGTFFISLSPLIASFLLYYLFYHFLILPAMNMQSPFSQEVLQESFRGPFFKAFSFKNIFLYIISAVMAILSFFTDRAHLEYIVLMIFFAVINISVLPSFQDLKTTFKAIACMFVFMLGINAVIMFLNVIFINSAIVQYPKYIKLANDFAVSFVIFLISPITSVFTLMIVSSFSLLITLLIIFSLIRLLANFI